MRLPCPHCGTRDAQEFSYLGDATVKRPDPDALSEGAMTRYVYERDNPAGLQREYWHHSAGCRAWIVVVRDTRTHRIASAEPARSAVQR
jgi:heterotetrameric sarcosine oxidase delta subunit